MNLEKQMYTEQIEYRKKMLSYYIKNKVDLTLKLKQNELMIELVQKQIVELITKETYL